MKFHLTPFFGFSSGEIKTCRTLNRIYLSLELIFIIANPIYHYVKILHMPGALFVFVVSIIAGFILTQFVRFFWAMVMTIRYGSNCNLDDDDTFTYRRQLNRRKLEAERRKIESKAQADSQSEQEEFKKKSEYYVQEKKDTLEKLAQTKERVEKVKMDLSEQVSRNDKILKNCAMNLIWMYLKKEDKSGFAIAELDKKTFEDLKKTTGIGQLDSLLCKRASKFLLVRDCFIRAIDRSMVSTIVSSANNCLRSDYWNCVVESLKRHQDAQQNKINRNPPNVKVKLIRY